MEDRNDVNEVVPQDSLRTRYNRPETKLVRSVHKGTAVPEAGHAVRDSRHSPAMQSFVEVDKKYRKRILLPYGRADGVLIKSVLRRGLHMSPHDHPLALLLQDQVVKNLARDGLARMHSWKTGTLFWLQGHGYSRMRCLPTKLVPRSNDPFI
jgi:hypothetical protein